MQNRWLKPLLLMAYLACDASALSARFASLGFSGELIMFLGLYGIMALALFAAAYIPKFSLRLITAVMLCAGSISLHSYEWATRQPLDYQAFEMMLASRGDAGDAIAQYGPVLVQATGAAALLFIALLLPPVGRRVAHKFSLGIPVAVLAMLSAMLFVRGGEGARALPAPFIPLAHAAIMEAVSFSEEGGERRTVGLNPSAAKRGEDIILIVDESIAGNYLDINNPGGVHSGLATDRPGMSISNFGIAASITNCSPGSNRSLRFGGQRSNYRLVGKTYPSIWAYAHKAGLRTVYLDGQRVGGELQNLATHEERAEIDDFVQLDDIPVVDRDQRLASLIAERLSNGRAEFIYVNKIGAHFPVADKFPDAMSLYRPIPERGHSASITDMGPIHGSHRGTPAEWHLYRNAYRNTLAWNVGSFFDRLLSTHDPKNGVILYTSDHGQDLHERDNPGKTTHCINEPLMEEGAVPLVVIDRAKAPRLDWATAAKTNHDRSSHFRIFPTLLTLMGYDPAQIAPTYGPTLLSQETDPMTFTINYFAALGKQPTWRKVERDKLASPPKSDATKVH